MSQVDVLYRALIDYRKNTRENKECSLQRKAIVSANNHEDVIEITSNVCTINEDWVEAIEKGIVFVEKAINEERQFIRSNGEIVPIEKVKRVSKDSVEHLAKHSNLVTREPKEGDDLVPDQLYMVERLSDYTVYENRFLYMLLCYLRDFISMRYEKILELTNMYQGRLSLNKTIVESNRRLVYEVNLVEEKKNDEYLREHNAIQGTLDRILTIYRAVTFFLSTPLMCEVAKVPMLKPPITRTNVLRMNRNFREALSLYEYIASYEGNGYEISSAVKTFSPFSSFVADEVAETVELTSFLTYEHGLEIKDYFKHRYEREEQKKKEEERRKLEEKLQSIRNHLRQEDIPPEEYIMLLEKRIADLENQQSDLAETQAILDDLYVKNERLNVELQYAQNYVVALKEEIVALNNKHEEEMLEEQKRHEQEIEQLNNKHEEEVESLVEQHKDEIQRLDDEHATEIDSINASYENKLDEQEEYYKTTIAEQTEYYEKNILNLQAVHENQVAQLNQTIDEIQRKSDEAIKARDYTIETERKQASENIANLEQKLASSEDEVNKLSDKCSELQAFKTLSDGRLTALRSKYGLIKPNEDFSTQEMADELEEQYQVFRQFRKEQWKYTKKRIRKDLFMFIKEFEEKWTKERLEKKRKLEEKNKNDSRKDTEE